jgi:uncharacterized protein (DUF1330 family)
VGPNRTFAIALAAGVALGAFGIEGLGAQSRPPTYFIVDISEITDPEGFKALAAKATPEILAGFGGKYVVRSQNIIAVEGVAPKRFVIAFDTPEHAKAWSEMPEIRAIRAETTKSRSFIVEGQGQP